MLDAEKDIEEKRYYRCIVCGKQFNLIAELILHENSIKNSTVKADYGRFKISILKSFEHQIHINRFCRLIKSDFFSSLLTIIGKARYINHAAKPH